MVKLEPKLASRTRQLGRALGYSDTWDAKTCTATGATTGGGSPTAGAAFGRVWVRRAENNHPVQAYNKTRVGTFAVGANVRVGQRIGSSELDIIEVDFARNVQDFSIQVADAFGAGPPVPPEFNQSLLRIQNDFNLRPYVDSALVLRARAGWLGSLYWDNTLTIDLDSHKTSTSDEWAWVVAYLYEDSGALAWDAVTGSDLTSADKVTADIEAALALVPAGGFPIVAVLLKDDATTMNVNDANTAEDVRNTWAFGGSGSTDPSAIHVDVADEINQISAKTTPHDDDVIVIEDSEDGWNKKAVTIGDLPGGGAGGAPDDAKYIVAAADSDLTNEIVIPGLAGSPDRINIGGGGSSYEFDSGSSPFTWNSAPASEDVNTTIPSHLYATATDNAERRGLVNWSPAGAFDARAKVLLGTNHAGTATISAGLLIENSDGSQRLTCPLSRLNQAFVVSAYSYASSTYTQRGVNWTVSSHQCYQRITRDGSNNVSFWYSTTGLLWQFIATVSFTFTVAKIGFIFSSDVNTTYQMAADWLRTDV